jgi:hypothetical protein
MTQQNFVSGNTAYGRREQFAAGEWHAAVRACV